MANKHSHRKPLRKEKSNKNLGMSIFIAFIMITSVFGVIFYGYAGSSEVIRYNDVKFTVTNLGYETTIAKEKYYFEYLPPEAESVNTDVNIIGMINNAKGIIITSDINTTYKEDIALASYNLNTLFTTQNKYSANAFTTNSTTLPAVTCENASITFPVIYITEANSTEITLDDSNEGCINFRFDTSYNLKRATSKLMYIILGIIEN